MNTKLEHKLYLGYSNVYSRWNMMSVTGLDIKQEEE